MKHFAQYYQNSVENQTYSSYITLLSTVEDCSKIFKISRVLNECGGVVSAVVGMETLWTLIIAGDQGSGNVWQWSEWTSCARLTLATLSSQLISSIHTVIRS